MSSIPASPSPGAALREEMRALVLRVSDGIAHTEEHQRLEALLRDSNAARRWYIEEFDVLGSLSWNNREAARAVLKGHQDPALNHPTVSDTQPRTATEANQVIGGPTVVSVQTRRIGFQLAAMAAAAVLYYGGFALIAWNLRPDHASSFSSGPSLPVQTIIANITAAKDCVWDRDPSQAAPYVGQRLSTDEAIALRSGVAEITFADGAVVVLEGPSFFMPKERGRGWLTSGKLVARLPKQTAGAMVAATGFTVETPTAKIVDRGTEFGVLTNQRGSTEVQVFEGLVEVHSTGAGSGAQPLRLSGGARAIVAGNGKPPVVERSFSEAALLHFEWAKSSMPGVARQLKAARPRLAWAPIALQNATADFSQSHGLEVSSTIDGDFSNTNGWAIADLTDASTEARTAVFETIADALVNRYTITLSQHYRDDQHTLGKFRISVTTDPRDTFADGLSRDGDVTTTWIELTPISATATGDTTLTINDDNSILASGTSPNTSVYTVVAASPLLKVTGFRLEMLTDPSLPTDGPGRAFNGNLVLTEFQVDAADASERKRRR